jgi:ribosomal protein L4
MMVLAAKLREGNLVVFDNLECETHKTRVLKEILNRHNLLDSTSIIIDEEFTMNFERAAANIPNVAATPLKWVNLYEILKKEKLIISHSCFMELQQRLIGSYTYSGKRNTIKRRLELLEDARLEAESKDSEQQMGQQQMGQ